LDADEEAMKPDIVCLQEVQVNLFSDLLQALTPTYEGVIQNVSGGHNVATAILLRNSCPFRFKRVESRSRALIAVLEDKDNVADTTDAAGLNCYRSLYLCSVHLDADKNWDRQSREFHGAQRQNQLKSLLKRLTNQCNLDKANVEKVPVIIAGDFNLMRDDPLHKSLADGELSSRNKIRLHDTYMEAERQDQLPVPLYRCDAIRDQGRLVKTYRGGAVLDYIWATDEVKVLCTLLCHPSSSTMGVEKWPSHDHPSDHIPVAVDIEWNHNNHH
jgi:mRNA deadenylase 3'-5' endonuclease subunit Ccr4